MASLNIFGGKCYKFLMLETPGKSKQKAIRPSEFRREVYPKFQDFLEQKAKKQRVAEFRREKELMSSTMPINFREAYSKCFTYHGDKDFLARNEEAVKRHQEILEKSRLEKSALEAEESKELTFRPKINPASEGMRRKVDDLIQWGAERQKRAKRSPPPDQDAKHRRKVKGKSVHILDRFVQLGREEPTAPRSPKKIKDVSDRLYESRKLHASLSPPRSPSPERKPMSPTPRKNESESTELFREREQGCWAGASRVEEPAQKPSLSSSQKASEQKTAKKAERSTEKAVSSKDEEIAEKVGKKKEDIVAELLWNKLDDKVEIKLEGKTDEKLGGRLSNRINDKVEGKVDSKVRGSWGSVGERGRGSATDSIDGRRSFEKEAPVRLDSLDQSSIKISENLADPYVEPAASSNFPTRFSFDESQKLSFGNAVRPKKAESPAEAGTQDLGARETALSVHSQASGTVEVREMIREAKRISNAPPAKLSRSPENPTRDSERRSLKIAAIRASFEAGSTPSEVRASTGSYQPPSISESGVEDLRIQNLPSTKAKPDPLESFGSVESLPPLDASMSSKNRLSNVKPQKQQGSYAERFKKFFGVGKSG